MNFSIFNNLPVINKIHDFTEYFQSIDWLKEKWILAIIFVHISIAISIALCRKVDWVLTILFITMGSIVFTATYINEFAGLNWKKFSHENYFDSSGMFFSIFVSFPIVINLLFILGVWFQKIFNLMIDIKRKQLIKQEKDKKNQ